MHGDKNEKTEQREDQGTGLQWGRKHIGVKALEFRPFRLSGVYVPCPFLSGSTVFPGFLCAGPLKINGALPEIVF